MASGYWKESTMENPEGSRGLFIVSTEIGKRYVAGGPDQASGLGTRPAKASQRTIHLEATENPSLELARV
jgi:hypothetical protein